VILEEKPDLRELVGSAVNTSNLASSDRRETALDRIGALGAAGARIAAGLDFADLPLAALQPEIAQANIALYLANTDMRDLLLRPPQLEARDPRDVIAGELGPTLWHVRYGGQHDQVPRAVLLFAAWLRHRRAFAFLASPEQDARLHAFAGRVLHEWLSDRCIACGGCGRQELTRRGNAIRPRGSMQRNATFRVCQACAGTGRQRPSQGERARAIEVTLKDFDAQHWLQRFDLATQYLNRLLDKRLMRPLTAELERRKKRR
jgi:hypothetical protein